MTIKGFNGLGQTHIKGRKDFAARMDRLIAEAFVPRARADTLPLGLLQKNFRRFGAPRPV